MICCTTVTLKEPDLGVCGEQRKRQRERERERERESSSNESTLNHFKMARRVAEALVDELC